MIHWNSCHNRSNEILIISHEYDKMLTVNQNQEAHVMESFWMILFFTVFFGAIIVLLIRAAIQKRKRDYPETEEERKMHEFTKQAAHNQAELNRRMKKL